MATVSGAGLVMGVKRRCWLARSNALSSLSVLAALGASTRWGVPSIVVASLVVTDGADHGCAGDATADKRSHHPLAEDDRHVESRSSSTFTRGRRLSSVARPRNRRITSCAG
jgi:hypothetical protein